VGDGRAPGADLSAVTIVTTTRCNQRCSYCCALGRPAASAPWPAVRAALDRLLASPAPSVRVAFTGGEPLLARPVVSRAVTYVDRHRRPGQSVRLKVQTNGLLLDDRAAAWLRKHDVHLQVSLDGVREAQDVRSAASFDVVAGRLSWLRERAPDYFDSRVIVAMTLVPEAVPHLADSVAWLTESGVSTIRMAPAMDAAPGGPRLLSRLDREFAAIFEHSIAHYRRTRRVPLQLFRRGPFRVRPAASRWSCEAPTGRTLAVDADGAVSTCLLASETYAASRPLPPALQSAAAALRVGQANGDLPGRLRQVARRAADAQVFSARRPRHSALRACSGCEWRDECVVCPLAVDGVVGPQRTLRVPELVCAFNQVTASWRAQFPVTSPPTGE
jgi:sulfatase maturation enzyme AslB (radical SAM superfamily)